MKDETGVFSISREEYDRSSRINWSRLKALDKSPAHFRDLTMNPRPDTDALKRGRATHCAVFEPDLYNERYVVWGERRAGKEYEKFKAEHEGAGRELITEAMDDAAKLIAAAARSDPRAMKYLSGGKAEKTVVWNIKVPAIETLPGYEVKCKGRPDFIADCGAVVDLKTCRDASPAGFGRAVAEYGYAAQMAYYVDGLAYATGQKRLPGVFVAVESAPPYAVVVYRVPEEILRAGREKYRALLDRLNVCVESNSWPGYADQELDLALPDWANPIEQADDTGMGLSFGGG